MHVMGIGAHPDDLEILAGGTLARFRQLGHPVWMCHVARGDRGATSGTREDLAATRRREAQASAAVIGAHSETLDIADGEVCADDPEQKAAMVELIRRVAPDVILTHSSDDYMEDHNQTSRLAFAASFLATTPLFEPATPAIPTVPALIYLDTLNGMDFQPTEFVDIGEHLVTKLDMMGCHRTQLEWLHEHDRSNVLEDIEVTARYRGHQCGVRHAEAFQPCLRWARARPARLLP